MTDSDDAERVPASLAAVRMGLCLETVKRRLRSGQLSGMRDNTGKWFVFMKPEPVPVDTPVTVGTRHDKVAGATTELPVPHSVHKAQIDQLTAVWSEMVDRVTAQAVASTQMLVERIDASEVRCERLESALLELSRPWWLRLIDALRRRSAD